MLTRVERIPTRHADEGYRLTYGGYDFLACRTFAKRDTIYSVGNQIGTGKESGQSWTALSPLSACLLPHRDRPALCETDAETDELLTCPRRHLRRGGP